MAFKGIWKELGENGGQGNLENAGERESMRNGAGDRRFALLSSVVKRIKEMEP